MSLCFDLKFKPEERAATLARYRVPNEASLRALEQSWQERLSASAELRSALEAATATYTSWLAGLAR